MYNEISEIFKNPIPIVGKMFTVLFIDIELLSGPNLKP